MSSPWRASMSPSAYKLTRYTYDNNDNLLTKTLRDGKQERYTYTILGRLSTDAVYASATAAVR